MGFYLCSTPYHIFVSLCHMYAKNEKGILYLTTHDEVSNKVFKKIDNSLNKLPLVTRTIVRLRNKKKERFFIEELIDHLFYKKIKTDLENSCVYLFPWTPYSLYTISNFVYQKADNVVLIEDGANLYSFPKPSKFKVLIKKYSYRISTDFYLDDKLKSILVQYPEKYPKHLKAKSKPLNLSFLFEKLRKEDKERLINIFLSDQELNNLLKLNAEETIIILTQPLSEDGYVSEDEKIKIYKEIVNRFNKHKVIMKKHPREKTTYNFPGVFEIDGYFPSEIFLLLGIRFKKAVGVCTSAISSINAEEKYNLDENFLQRRNKI
jgi:hypothetical protein